MLADLVLDNGQGIVILKMHQKIALFILLTEILPKEPMVTQTPMLLLPLQN